MPYPLVPAAMHWWREWQKKGKSRVPWQGPSSKCEQRSRQSIRRRGLRPTKVTVEDAGYRQQVHGRRPSRHAYCFGGVMGCAGTKTKRQTVSQATPVLWLPRLWSVLFLGDGVIDAYENV